ncbi:transporter substrate-binding domain-containing protein [Candidatus Cetobacterium colombiensis]|uniref:Transporter substrate-binding domain-containing protein n=1 Tax=Candidatus Cetobacterium colombiensis TaxID=3073100 RepID=A0ABU4WAK9_9FUSO|nr:transporter substrate-binding domain-containing protein [Candidatus Cetobacterium colombiensis]MDX8336185.1 transporter substrate-binding domain-containing protein [Candidatus Cetobacterium colombiensis]
MKGTLKGIFIILLAIIIFSCGKKEEKITNNRVFVIGTNAEYPPFEYLENGKIVGLDAEIIETIFQKLGYKYNWVNMEFGGLISALQTGKIDMIIAGMSITPERSKMVKFTSPYLTSKVAVITNKKNPIKNMNDLENKKYGAELGTTKENTAKNIPGSIVIPYQNNTSALLALKNNQIDGIVLDESVANEYVKNNSDLLLVGVLEGEPKAIALGKNEIDYDKINETLIELVNDGTIEKLKEKYKVK